MRVILFRNEAIKGNLEAAVKFYSMSLRYNAFFVQTVVTSAKAYAMSPDISQIRGIYPSSPDGLSSRFIAAVDKTFCTDLWTWLLPVSTPVSKIAKFTLRTMFCVHTFGQYMME